MASLQPPNYANLKRKRARSTSTSTSHLPPESLNPHSYRPNTLKQLFVAGLDESDLLPSQTNPQFPHRPQRDADEPQPPASSEKAKSPAPAPQLHRDRQAALLAALTERLLHEGDTRRAQRAFALLVRSGVDLRQGQYWALGAEVLMREGEETRRRREEEGEEPARWGTAANAVRVRAYYEDLIQLYPYNRTWPRSVSALTFWPVMIGVDMYNVYVEERLARERAEREEGGQEDDDGAEAMFSDPMDVEDDEEEEEEEEEEEREREVSLGPRKAQLRREREKIRLQALGEMRDIARRMDAVMEAPPYASSHEMLRLRGMVALYMGDLAVPTAPRSEREDYEGRAKKADERERARNKFGRILSENGELEASIVRFVRHEDDDSGDDDNDDDDDRRRPGMSVLPIRTATG